MIAEQRRVKRYLYVLEPSSSEGLHLAFASDMDPVELMRLRDADQNDHGGALAPLRFRIRAAECSTAPIVAALEEHGVSRRPTNNPAGRPSEVA